MRYIGLFLIVIIIAGVLSYFESRFEKLSPPGKFNNSYKANFLRNTLTFSAIVIILMLVRIWF